MSEDNKNFSIFSGVNDAINKNRKRTPKVEKPGVVQNVNGLIKPGSNIESVQQQFLDWQVNKIAHDLYTRTIYYDTDRVNSYQDFRAMDMSPEISAALNIIRDECLEANTKILLLSDEKSATIEELYERGEENFSVYSYNLESKEIETAICERVVYKGEQDVYKIIFDDDSNVMATSEHLWLINENDVENKYFKTSELSKGQLITVCYCLLKDEDIKLKNKNLLRCEYRQFHPPINNYRVKSVEFVGKRNTYDLVNVGKHHNFAILTSNGTGVFTHNCITRGEKGKILDIFSENSRVKTLLEDLFYNRLDVDFALKLWIRDLLKYGDFFLHLHIDKEEGIYDVMALPSEEIHREEGFEGRTDDVRFRWETTGDYFEDWQIAHFRLLEDNKKLPYGRSILDPARKLWKQLQLAEDSLLVYRITRAPERRVFYIDVGNLEHADVGQFIQQFQMQLKKQPIVDQKTGNINMKYNPMNVTEDYFIPMRADRSSKIETLPGACLALDTKIELLDGRSLELNEIIKEFNDGKELWSYSINPNTGEIVPGKISWAGITRKDTQVVKITLDNGETITTTPDHKFPTRFNGIKEAKDLSKGESLWAFNKKFEKIFKNKPKAKKYEMIYNHNQNKWVYTHRMVAEYFKNLSEEGLDKKREIVKFNFKKDSDKLQELLKDKGYKKESYRNWVIEKQKIKYSNEMLNFVVDRLKDGLTAKEIIFEINLENSLFMNEFNKLNKNNKQSKKKSNSFTHNNLVKMMIYFGYSNWKDFKNKIDYFNHKIVSIEFLEKTQDTGTITIDGSEIYHDYHNFALSVGVFTQNSNLGDIADIEYFQNKLFASLQVPKNYLNYGESLPGGSTLSQQDLRFSRTINTIQQSVLAELKRIANIHLFFNGFEDDINNFTLTLNNPSTQQELLKLETMKARLEVFKEMFSAEATSPVSYVWAMENILGFSKNEIKLILKQKKVEKKIFAEIDSSVEMYKKIGLFKELDEKFEIPGAEEMMSNQQAGDSDEGKSFDGGGGFSGGGGFDTSGGEVGGEEVEGEEMSSEDSEEPSGEEAPISEGSIKKAMKVSDYYTSLLINELLGSDEVKKSKKIEDNALIKRNDSMNFESKKLIDSIEKSLSKIDGGKKLIRESDENSLLENSDKLDKDSEILMGEIERFLKNRKNK